MQHLVSTDFWATNANCLPLRLRWSVCNALVHRWDRTTFVKLNFHHSFDVEWQRDGTDYGSRGEAKHWKNIGIIRQSTFQNCIISGAHSLWIRCVCSSNETPCWLLVAARHYRTGAACTLFVQHRREATCNVVTAANNGQMTVCNICK